MPRRKKVPPAEMLKAKLDADVAKCHGAFSQQRPLPTQEDLPYRWQLCKTKEGKVFYFNSMTSEKSWDPPDALEWKQGSGWYWDPSKEADGGANSWAAY
jgi:hypothetical protein